MDVMRLEWNQSIRLSEARRNIGLSSLPVISNQTATNRSFCGNHGRMLALHYIVSNLIADMNTRTSLSGQPSIQSGRGLLIRMDRNSQQGTLA